MVFQNYSQSQEFFYGGLFRIFWLLELILSTDIWWESLCAPSAIHIQSIEHILFNCSWSQRTWFPYHLGYHSISHQIPSLGGWFTNFLLPSSTSVSQGSSIYTHICFLLWNIWKHRYSCIFNNTTPNPAVVAFQSYMASSEFLNNASTALEVPPQLQDLQRPPPKPKWLAPILSFPRLRSIVMHLGLLLVLELQQ